MSIECLILPCHLFYFFQPKMLPFTFLFFIFFTMSFMMNEKIFMFVVNITSVFNQLHYHAVIYLNLSYFATWNSFNIMLPPSTKVDAILRSTIFIFQIHWYHYHAQGASASSFLLIILWVISTEICLNIIGTWLISCNFKTMTHFKQQKIKSDRYILSLDCKTGSHYRMFVWIYSGIMESSIKCQNIKTWVNLALLCNNLKVIKIFEK